MRERVRWVPHNGVLVRERGLLRNNNLVGLGTKRRRRGPTTLTFVGSTTGTGTSIAPHGSAVAGDLAIYLDLAVSTSAGGYVTPTDFTAVCSDTGDIPDGYARISYKVLIGGEGSITGMTSDTRRKAMLVFHPDRPINSVILESEDGALTPGNPSARVFSAAGHPPPLLLVGQMGTRSNAISPRTISPSMTEVAGAATNHYVHYKIYNVGDTPADHTYDMDDEGDQNTLQAVVLSFT